MKTYKCILAVLLAVMIVLTVIPAVAAADTLKLTIVCEHRAEKRHKARR